MDLQNLLETIVNTVLIPAIPIVVGAAVQYVRTKTEGSKIEEAVGIVLDAVDQTNQTFADQLRKDGSFTEEKQREAMEKSVKTALSMMNERTLKILEREFNDVEAWIVSKIEAACKENKRINS